MKKLPYLLTLLLVVSACTTQRPTTQLQAPLLPPTLPPATQPAATSVAPQPATSTGPVPTMLPIQENNLYGIPHDSPEWLVLPIGLPGNDTPYNILILGSDYNCRLTINTKADFSGLTQQKTTLVLGAHTWVMLKTFQGDQQVDEIYYPDVYPMEYREGGGVDGNGYAMSGFYDSCRSAIQGILARVPPNSH